MTRGSEQEAGVLLLVPWEVPKKAHQPGDDILDYRETNRHGILSLILKLSTHSLLLVGHHIPVGTSSFSPNSF